MARPVRPVVEVGDGQFVGGGDGKILDARRLPVGERQRRLFHCAFSSAGASASSGSGTVLASCPLSYRRLARYRWISQRDSTATTAATGTARKIPTTPINSPPAKMAKITHTGCSPTLLPISIGVQPLPLTPCTITNTTQTRLTLSQSEPNWPSPTSTARAEAKNGPASGTKASSPAIRPST